MFLTLKALHIVALVAWFAGLFYIVRLFVYLRETQDRPPAERAVLEPQLQLMSRRLWFGITWPAGIATVIFGTWLASYFVPPPPWLMLKFVLVAGLLGYHGACHVMHARLQAGHGVASGRFFRIWNEVATLFLVAIVFVVVLKDGLKMVYGVAGLLVFAAVLMVGITAYRRLRQA